MAKLETRFGVNSYGGNHWLAITGSCHDEDGKHDVNEVEEPEAPAIVARMGARDTLPEESDEVLPT